MVTSHISREVKFISLNSIDPSTQNPRGMIDKGNENFQRLVESIKEVGILVPLVVHERAGRCELIDGERRYWAAKELGMNAIPAYILRGSLTQRDIRNFMFHLHMTREQWGAIAQCKSLEEAYRELETGIRLKEKDRWTNELAREKGMTLPTARDRVNFLCWPKDLRACLKKLFCVVNAPCAERC